jgi:phosphoglucomutase
MEALSVSLDVKLHFMLYEVDGEERFHVHAKGEDGKMVDVTEQYELIAARDPTTDRRGMMLMKK